MKNKTLKTLAIFGIGAYVLSVLSSATNLEGNFVASDALIFISGVAMIVFVIMATIRLWKEGSKSLSIIFASLVGTRFITDIVIFQEIVVLADGSPITIITNIITVVYVVAFIFVIVRLFKMKEGVVINKVDG